MAELVATTHATGIAIPNQQPPRGPPVEAVPEHRPSKRRHTQHTTGSPAEDVATGTVTTAHTPATATSSTCTDVNIPEDPVEATPPARSRGLSAEEQQRATCTNVLAAAAVCLSPGASPLQPLERHAVTMLLDSPPTDVGALHSSLCGGEGAGGVGTGEGSGTADVLSLPGITTALCEQLEGLHGANGQAVEAAWCADMFLGKSTCVSPCCV